MYLINKTTKSLLFGLAIALSVTTSGYAQTSAASTYLERAKTLAAKGSVSSAQIQKALADGRKMKIIKDQKPGRDLDAACRKLLAATNNSAGLNALQPNIAITMAQCSGFFE